MTNVTPEAERIAKLAWDSSQRIAVQIAEKPLEEREAAFKLAEGALRESAVVFNMRADQVDGWIKIQIPLIRQMVTEIDVGGAPQGGNA